MLLILPIMIIIGLLLGAMLWVIKDVKDDQMLYLCVLVWAVFIATSLVCFILVLFLQKACVQKALGILGLGILGQEQAILKTSDSKSQIYCRYFCIYLKMPFDPHKNGLTCLIDRNTFLIPQLLFLLLLVCFEYDLLINS